LRRAQFGHARSWIGFSSEPGENMKRTMKQKKMLVLHTETVKALSEARLGEVAGGQSQYTLNCIPKSGNGCP
jgi:hypothetical protein